MTPPPSSSYRSDKTQPADARAKVPPSDSSENRPRKSFSLPRYFLLILIIGLVILGFLIYFLGIQPRLSNWHELNEEKKESVQERVLFILPRKVAALDRVTLPGDVQAFLSASIYARTNGYVKRWLVDIGDPVKQGQLLAEIEAPELDQQVSQARASLAQAMANLNLAKIDDQRYGDLIKQNAVSQEEYDQKKSALQAREADYNAAEANLLQLTALQQYENITAPFDGTVTSRTIDIGDLINSGSSSTSAKALFQVDQTDVLRVYVKVPENFAPLIKPEVPADIAVRELPGQTFKGKVVRSAGAIDTSSRTLLTEVDVPNQDKTLDAGMYAEVTLYLSNNRPALRLPGNTLIFRAQGSQLALVDNNNKIVFRKVAVGRDLGAEIEILQGIEPDDRVVTNPGDELQEGMSVEAKPYQAAQPANGQSNNNKPAENNPNNPK